MKCLIAGNIVDTEADRYTPEDVCPAMVSEMIKGLEPNEPIELEITSYGGSVPAGLAIANMLKMASAEGHKTTAHVIGIAASMASALACACDVLKIDSNAFAMIHNPYTYAVGDAGDMRKEADTLDKMKSALIAIYRTKFDVADEVIAKMMDEETWIIGKDAATYKLNAEIIETAEPLKAAAFAGRELPKWLHTPQTITDLIASKEEKMAEVDYFGLNDAEVKEIRAEADALSQQREEVVAIALAHDTEPCAEAEMITKAEADKRVSGMQASMQKQINDLKKDYEERIKDFENQVKTTGEELTKAKAEVTRLTESFEKSNRELAETTSALAEKTTALASLNASVLTPNEVDPNSWKNLKGEAFFAWVKNHPECLKTH